MNFIQFLLSFYIIFFIICDYIPRTFAQQTDNQQEVQLVDTQEIDTQENNDDCTVVADIFNKLRDPVITNHYQTTKNKNTKNKQVIPSCCDEELDGNVKCKNIDGRIRVYHVRLKSSDLSHFNEYDLSEIIEMFTKLPYVTYISFAENNIKCKIPDNIGKLKQLTNLSFRHNELVGSIPESLGELTNLVYLDLSENHFNGKIPNSLGELKNLKILNLNDNNFYGTVPYSFRNLQGLEQFQLNNTAITGYIPDFPNMNNCSFTNSNICFLKGTNNICRVPINSGISDCTEKEIKSTDNSNGRFGEDKRDESKTPIVAIVCGIVVILIVAVIGAIMFVRKKRTEKDSKIILDPINSSRYSLTSNQNENSTTADDSQSDTPTITPINKTMSHITISNNDSEGNAVMRNTVISTVQPYMSNVSFVNAVNMNTNLNHSPTLSHSLSMNRSFSINHVNTMNLMPNASFTAGMNNDLYYMPGYVVVDQTSPDYINTMNNMMNNMNNAQGTLPTTLPLSFSHMNSINGHNIISVQNANEPVLPNRQMTIRNKEQATKLTKEEEAKIDRENKKNTEGGGDDDELPSYEEL